MSKTLKSNLFSPLFPPFDIIKNLSKKHAWENTYYIIKTVKTDFSGKTQQSLLNKTTSHRENLTKIPEKEGKEIRNDD